MLDNLRMCGRITFKLGIRIIQHMIHTWQKFLLNLLSNTLKIIANKNITYVKVTKSCNITNFQEYRSRATQVLLQQQNICQPCVPWASSPRILMPLYTYGPSYTHFEDDSQQLCITFMSCSSPWFRKALWRNIPQAFIQNYIFVNETEVSSSHCSWRWSHQVLVGCPVAGPMNSKVTYDRGVAKDFIMLEPIKKTIGELRDISPINFTFQIANNKGADQTA